MALNERKTPARLASPAASKLPRRFLFLVMLAYIMAGLFGRDPWKTDDVAGLATMSTALHADQWLTPYIGTLPYTDAGPLPAMIGGLFIYLFSPLFTLFTSALDAQIMAARLPNLLYFSGMLWGVWYGTYLLARRPETQPLPLPFDGEPNPRDYGRMLADVSFFFMLATVGLIIRLHETSFFPLLMCIHGLAFYGFVRLLDHPTQGSIVIGITIAAAFMTKGLIGATPLLLVALSLFISRIYTIKLKVFLAIALILAGILSVAWFMSAHHTNPIWTTLWWREQLHVFSLQNWLDAPKKLRDLAWFLWPSWPFALLAIWNWRQWLDKPHIFIPSSFILANFALIFSVLHSFESEYAPLSIGVVVLAAMAIPTLKRSIINMLDWYSIMVISLGIMAIWLGWVALYTGIPTQLNHNIMRLIPGFDTSITWIIPLLGLLICLLWYKAVAWRLKANPQAMWRGIILSAAGTTLSWVLLSVLWLPAIDYNRSYRGVGEQLQQVLKSIPQDTCISNINLGTGQAASLYVFSQLQLSTQPNCPYVLIQTTSRSVNSGLYTHSNKAQILWQGQRQSERHGETFLLLDLKHPTSPN